MDKALGPILEPFLLGNERDISLLAGTIESLNSEQVARLAANPKFSSLSRADLLRFMKDHLMYGIHNNGQMDYTAFRLGPRAQASQSEYIHKGELQEDRAIVLETVGDVRRLEESLRPSSNTLIPGAVTGLPILRPGG